MNYRRLSDNDLADFALNVAAQLGGTQLTAINIAVRTALSTAIGTLPDDLSDQVKQASTNEAVRMASVSMKNATREQLIAFISQVKNALLAGVAPKDQYDLCGFDYRESSPGPYQAQDPTELSAVGFSNGVNEVKFRGNNRSGSVTYEVWRRYGNTSAWALHSTTTKQSFTDAPVTPGQYYEYKVRAAAAKSVSNFSNSAPVYGI